MEASMQVFTLGGLKIWRGDEPVTNLGSRKTEALVVYLLSIQRPQAREVLADLLWDDRTQKQALSNLRGVIRILRKQFESCFLITNTEVALNPAVHIWFDAAEFEAGLLPIQKTGGINPTAEVDQAARVIDLYKGEFLEGFYVGESRGFDAWMVQERERLHHLALSALSDLVNFCLEQREYQHGIARATRLLELDPLMESAHRQMMHLLALSGKRALAMKQYETLQQTLAQELDIEPEPESQQLYEDIRAGRLSADVPKPVTKSPSETRPSHNLPPSLTPLIGRESDLKKVAALLHDPTCRLVTLAGPGGIGKTRLAIQAAEDLMPAFQHGAWFVPLESLDAASFLAEAIAAALGLPLLEGAKPAEQLLEFLRHKELLLILDNFEHLLPSGTGLLIEILQAAPGVQLLVTSREIINLQAECLYEVRGLSFQEDGQAVTVEAYPAAALFLQLARRAAANAVQDEDNNHAARIAWLVEGSPLAIELASAWTRVLSCREIAEEIERGLGFLRADQPDLPTRHRSMRAVFNQSWRLLSGEEKSVFRQLSVFRGGFERQTANQVAGASLDTLKGLADKSLIGRHPNGRYHIHTLLREFAARELEQAGEVVATRERHLAYFLQFAEQAEPELWRDQEKIWLDRLEAEHDNLRKALEWSLSPQSTLGVRAGLGISLALEMFWWNHSHYGEAIGWLDNLLAHPKAAEYPTAFAHGLRSAATLNYRVFGKFEVARAQFERSMAIAKQHGDPLVLAHVLSDFANFCTIIEHNLLIAHTYFERSLMLFRKLKYQPGIVTALRRLGHHSKANGDLPAARSYYRESVRLCRILKHTSGTAWGLYELGWISARTGNITEARDFLEESLMLYRELNAVYIEAQVLAELGRLEFATGEITQATGYLDEMLAVYRKYGIKMDMPEILTFLGDISRYQEEFAKALSYYDEALALAQGMGYKKIQISALLAKSFVFLRQGDGTRALHFIEQGLLLSREVNFPYQSAIAMIGLAGLSAAGRNAQRAARLWGTAEEMLESTFIAITYNSADHAEYKRIKGQIQQQLDNATFNQLVQEGHAVAAEGLDRVVAYALEEN